jgi:hypothetical protein
MSEKGKNRHLFLGLLPATVQRMYRFMRSKYKTKQFIQEVPKRVEDIASKREKALDAVSPTEIVLLLKK